MPSRAHELLCNRRLLLVFDKKTGRLAQITNLETAGDHLRAQPTGGNLFAVYHDFTGLFDISAGTPRTATDPQTITRSAFSPAEASSVSFRRARSAATERLAIAYRGERSRATVAFSLARDAEAVRCSLRLTNADTVPATFIAVFPYLSGIRLGRGKNNLMVVNDQAGYVRCGASKMAASTATATA
jgi:hypothetical protein